MISRNQRITSRPRVLLTILALLYVTNFSEGKLHLVPRGKKKNLNEKKNLRQTLQKQNHHHQQKQQHKKKSDGKKIILKPKKKKMEGPKLQLQATIGKNENGEKVLLLTEESAAALSSAMENTEIVEEKLQETEPIKQVIKQTSNVEEDETHEHQVLFYDPDELKTAPGELPLPKRVFDADGNEVDMSGKEALLIPPDHHQDEVDGHKDVDPPSPPHKDDEPIQNISSSSSIQQERSMLQTPQTQDQMIIISTVATMALLVGALSARRLRSRPFLSFCIENESLEDELAYDAAYTTQSTVGASSFYAGAGYDTFGGSKFGGDLRWRGDLEKFDV
mmetsp:Transcript_3338/g.6243  ORF Transcript_3338/g.6243 Transcript_3338/m.6243 type:complete len:334 (+) Transcript_3338:96-1097(+)